MPPASTTTSSTLPTLPVCEVTGASCDDGDPCTDDACTPGIGCENVDKIGLASLTCTCERSLPSVCGGQTITRAIQRQTARACRLFNAAVDAKPRAQVRRLRRASRALRRAVAAVVRAQIKGLAPECAAALAEQYRATGNRAVTLAQEL